MKTIIGFQSDDENKIFVGKSYEKGKSLQLTIYGNKLAGIGIWMNGLKNKNLIKNYQK